MAQDPRECADLEILAVDLRLLDLTTLDFGVDHLSGRLRRWRWRLVTTEPEQILRGRASRKRQLRHQDQKKNAKPTFHSSTSSLSFLLVNTT